MRACGHWCQSAALIYRKISKECVRFHGYFTGYFPAIFSPSRKCTIRASNGARSGSETESLLFNQYFLFALFHILRNAIPMLLWMNFSVIRTYWDWLHTEKCFVLWYLRLLPLAEKLFRWFSLIWLPQQFPPPSLLPYSPTKAWRGTLLLCSTQNQRCIKFVRRSTNVVVIHRTEIPF